MKEKRKYTLDLEEEKWEGRSDDPVCVTRRINKEKKKIGKHIKNCRAITGA